MYNTRNLQPQKVVVVSLCVIYAIYATLSADPFLLRLQIQQPQPQPQQSHLIRIVSKKPVLTEKTRSDSVKTGE